jgi:hypothetical protein
MRILAFVLAACAFGWSSCPAVATDCTGADGYACKCYDQYGDVDRILVNGWIPEPNPPPLRSCTVKLSSNGSYNTTTLGPGEQIAGTRVNGLWATTKPDGTPYHDDDDTVYVEVLGTNPACGPTLVENMYLKDLSECLVCP